jgi:hypothetical protein
MRAAQKSHVELVKLARRLGILRRGLANRMPTQYWHLMFDNAKKILLPNHRPFPKSWCSKSRLQYNLFGCLSSSDNTLHWYSYPNLVPEDPNAIISLLWNVLFQMFKNTPSPSRPPVLFLQADNCSRENKNQVLFAFLHWMVYKGMFQVIVLNYFPVGHTHDLIDSTWVSCFNDLRIRTINNQEDLYKMMKDKMPSNYQKKMNQHFSGFYDWKQFFHRRKEITGHKDASSVCIKYKSNGTVALWFHKQQEYEPDWWTNLDDESGILLFDSNVDFVGAPSPIHPSPVPADIKDNFQQHFIGMYSTDNSFSSYVEDLLSSSFFVHYTPEDSYFDIAPLSRFSNTIVERSALPLQEYRNTVSVVPPPRNPIFFEPNEQRNAFVAFVTDSTEEERYAIARITSTNDDNYTALLYRRTNGGVYLPTTNETQVEKERVLITGRLLTTRSVLHQRVARKISTMLQKRNDIPLAIEFANDYDSDYD